MKKCFIFILNEKMFGVPMVVTKAGWEMFVGPATFIGELSSVKDIEVGVSTTATIEAHAANVPDEEVNSDLLVNFFSKYGLKSYKSIFK